MRVCCLTYTKHISDRKRECVSELVYRMCEENAVDKLMTFNFAGFADEVEDALAFKARNVDPRVRPFYSRILYTWYTSRGDYRNCKLDSILLTFPLAHLLCLSCAYHVPARTQVTQPYS